MKCGQCKQLYFWKYKCKKRQPVYPNKDREFESYWRLGRFSPETFWHVTVGKAGVNSKLMMAEFHLVASVSGSWYSTCCLTATLSWLTGTLQKIKNKTEPWLVLFSCCDESERISVKYTEFTHIISLSVSELFHMVHTLPTVLHVVLLMVCAVARVHQRPHCTLCFGHYTASILRTRLMFTQNQSYWLVLCQPLK